MICNYNYSWHCLSYSHKCPPSLLLAYAQSSPTPRMTHLAAAGVMNLSTTVEGKVNLMNLSGLELLLNIIQVGDEETIIYAAGALWNMIKVQPILLRLETRLAMLKNQLDKVLSRILTVPTFHFQLEITAGVERGVDGILDSLHPNNMTLALSALASTTSLSLRCHYYDHPMLYVCNNTFTREKNVKKEITRKISNGKVYAVCPICEKRCKSTPSAEPFLTCQALGCDIAYHLQCSSWKTLDEEYIEEQSFFCPKCISNEYVTRPDLRLHVFPQNPSDLLSENQWKKVHVLRNELEKDATYLRNVVENPYSLQLVTPQGIVIGIGRLVYYIEEKHKHENGIISDEELDLLQNPYAIFQLVYKLESVCNMWYNDEIVPCNDSYTFTFLSQSYGNKKDTVANDLLPGQYLVWPRAWTEVINTDIPKSKELLQGSLLYQFQDMENKTNWYSYGGMPGKENGNLWHYVHASRTKCAKALMDGIRVHRTAEKIEIRKKREMKRLKRQARTKVVSGEAESVVEESGSVVRLEAVPDKSGNHS